MIEQRTLLSRRNFLIVAAALGVLLVGLVIYLAWLNRSIPQTTVGGPPKAGIQPVLAITGPGSGDEPEFKRPMGAAFGPDGERIYVADTANNRVVIFDAQGRFIREFGGHGIAKPLAGAERTWDPGELNYPTDVAVAENGDVYVADFYNDSISVFDAEGGFLRRFPDPDQVTGKGGSGSDGKGIAVTSLTVAGDRVYATDSYQIFVFDLGGNVVGQFGRPGRGPRGLDHPGGVSVDASGSIRVSDSNNNRVVSYNAEFAPVWFTGRPVSDLRSRSDNPVVLPRGSATMPDGSSLVADPLMQQLIRLDGNGKVIASYGTRGVAVGEVNFPNDVSVHEDAILIADRENDRVQVVRLADR